MAGSLASINIKFLVNLRELSTDLQNANREIQKAGNDMQAVGKRLSVITLAVVAAGAGALKMASDFQESQNKVSVAFKDSANVVQTFAKTSLTSFGIAEGSALDMASGYGDMATSMQISEAQAAKMSTALVGLAGDLASFKNKGIDQTSKALEGVFTGETESLKMLGIVMTEANLAQFALSQGITKSLKNFTQAEKVQLRYAYVMQQTTNAQGDFARTGGGAANQVRVFQEGMKELGAQLGAVILPTFTDLVKIVNSAVAALGAMDPETQKMVVGFGLAAAAIGPLIYAIGTAIKAYGNLAEAVYSFAATLAANPMTAFAVALGAIVSTMVIANSRFSPLTNAAKEFNEVMASGSDAIAKETAELNKNLSVAQNEKISKEERKKAIENLNALSPEYLGNLTLENINTDAARVSTEKYTEALKQKARVMAAQEKLVAVEKQLLDLQMGQLDAVKPDLWQMLAISFKAGGDQAQYMARAGQVVAENLQQETTELEKLRSKLLGFMQDNDKFVAGQGNAANAISDLNIAMGAGAKSGTTDYYDERIEAIQKLRDSVADTSAEYQKFTSQIEALEKRRDALQGKRPKVTSVMEGVKENTAPGLQKSDARQRVDFFQKQIEAAKQAQLAYAETDEQFKSLAALIQGYELQVKLIVDPSSVIKAKDEVVPAFDAIIAKQEELQQFSVVMGDAVAGAFEGMTGRFLDSLGMANDGLQGFFKGLAMVVLKIISAMLAQSISQAIAGATAAGAATGPAAPFTTPAFIAEMIGGVLAAFASIPKFETGGVVSGSSYFGDKILARVNSGELILNSKQQKRVWDMIEPAGSNVNVVLDGAFKINGSDLELILSRIEKRNNRTR